MNTILTNDTKAILLLCGVFGRNCSVKPLAPLEYNKIVRCLIHKNLRPEDLLQNENADDVAVDSGINQERFRTLLGRGVQLGFAVEEWQRNGIWIISRSDKNYPARYKNHLKDQAPPLLFGIGDQSLLQGGGIAIIGSRNVDDDGELFTRLTAELCANNKMPVVSGGARGVDQIAMTAALCAGGSAIGVLAENLLKKSLERNARNSIADGRLILISPYHPTSRFTVGTAMGRNKLIYAMADYGLVVSADYNKGGTWAGAKEELRRENSLTVFVRSGLNVPSGNKNLLNLGALKWPEMNNRDNLSQLLVAEKQEKQEATSLFEFQEEYNPQSKELNKTDDIDVLSVKQKTEKDAASVQENAVYQAVLPIITNQLSSPATVDELSKTLTVSKMQLNSWLKKAVNEGKIRKLSRPARFEKIKTEQMKLIN